MKMTSCILVCSLPLVGCNSPTIDPPLFPSNKVRTLSAKPLRVEDSDLSYFLKAFIINQLVDSHDSPGEMHLITGAGQKVLLGMQDTIFLDIEASENELESIIPLINNPNYKYVHSSQSVVDKGIVKSKNSSNLGAIVHIHVVQWLSRDMAVVEYSRYDGPNSARGGVCTYGFKNNDWTKLTCSKEWVS